MATRMYLVQLARKKVLIEATSQEAAIRAATKPMVKSVTIPTPLEVARLMRDGEVEVIAPSLGPAPEKSDGTGDGEGVGRMGLADAGGDEGAGDAGEKSD